MSLRKTIQFILDHPMNRGRPISTIARFTFWQLRSRLQDEIVVDWVKGARLAARKGMTGATGNIYCGLHEYVDMSFVLDTLKESDLFVDIGANVGSYSILGSKVCRARTISFEPDPDTVRSLRRNIALNNVENLVEVVEAALGSEVGQLEFTVGRDTVNRVAQQGDKETRVVEVRTLDEVLSGRIPRIIKIDVEGFEAEVLKGAQKTLASPGLEAIITEAFDEDVTDVLCSYGFQKVFYDPPSKSFVQKPTFKSNNGIFSRPELMTALSPA